MWIVVYIAQGKDKAEQAKLLLDDAGIPVKLRPLSAEEFACDTYEILVPELEADEAHRVILELDL